MGTGSFFGNLQHVLQHPLNFSGDIVPGSWRQSSASPNDVGPYTGVAASLAGANSGYTAGGPGSNPGVATAPNATPGSPVPLQNPYVQAVRQAVGQQPQRQWGS